jgi:hypothetical protein
MDKQRRWPFVRVTFVAVIVLVGLALFGVWSAYSQPVFGQAQEATLPGPDVPGPDASAQTESLEITGSDNPDPVYTTDTIILPGALQVAKSFTPDSVYASDLVTFVIALRNITTVTFGITVTDQLVPELTIVCGNEYADPEGVSPVCDAQQNVITYTAPITAQTGLTLTFQARLGSTLLSGRRISNTVWAYYGENSISDTVTLTVAGPTYIYLPLVMRRWPPIPYPPSISVTTPDLGGNYTVSWTYNDHPAITAPTSYVLQESLDANFSTSTSYTVSISTYAYNFTNKPNGLYYYRVRGLNAYGPGVWSQTVTALVNRVFFDDFTDPASGWHTGEDQRYNFWDPNHPGWETVSYINYVDSHYRFYIPLTRHGGGDVDTWWVWPAVSAPLPAAMQPVPQNYCVEARAHFISHTGTGIVWWAHWGIVFAANTEFNDIYTFQINDNRNRAVIHYPSYVYPGNNNIRYSTVYNDGWTNIELRPVDWENDGYQFYNIYSNPSYNTIKVVVRGGRADCYVNGIWMTYYDFGAGLPHAKIGLIAGDWEITPQELQVDYFRYDPLCPEAQP